MICDLLNEIWLLFLEKENLKILKDSQVIVTEYNRADSGWFPAAHYVLIAKPPHNAINILWDTQYFLSGHIF